ncbi:amidophosphoribosyltransferase [Thermotoga sp. Mc24]|uniref:amidophosphoribosyltransferase n=1 Tax=Thermotoga sp. Mc24 TaxID=1231241 RepID=UPI00054253CB|nr:amidophosphoribosyltransferase [Thermotoga sp. Mc24]KHC91469.1 amidophosphoribosyltransferase [Thermotoga sp. Mc24]
MCGIAGVWNVKDAFSVLHDVLLGLQHRGQESVGVVVDGFKTIKGKGLVDTVLTEDRWEDAEKGIGHVRYSTAGSLEDIQPIVAFTRKGRLAIAHNGNIPNGEKWIEMLKEKGAVFQSSLDSEVFLHLISMSEGDLKESIVKALKKVPLAYSLLILHEEFLAAARDPYGVRPLFYGKYGDGIVVASEDAALKAIGVEDIEEVPPGTVVFFSNNGAETVKFARKEKRFCSFEFIYFARPDSHFLDQSVHIARYRMGEELYRENPIEADVVVPVLDSGLSGAMGFSSASGIPLDIGLMRNRYVGRSFIMPVDREKIVKKKLVPIEDVVSGKRVVVIDDSIVRGTTMGIIVKILREAGAKEVHVGIHSPPVRFPCFYGIDTARKKELVAGERAVEEVKKIVNADSLFYLSLEGLKRAIGRSELCVACFSGEYLHE